MARFLVAWEYGGDLGHLRRVLPIGRALRELGHHVAFAFRDATRLALPSAEGFAAWPAPVVPRPRVFNGRPANAADILLNLGFDHPASLRGALRGWDALFTSEAPDVLIADYAPGALIAARSRAIPRATVGSGFALPPRETPLPAIRDGAGTDAAARAALDARLRDTVAAATGDDSFDIHALFRGASNLLTTLPELDPLGPRAEEYVGPIGAAGEGLHETWSPSTTPRVFAYLKPRDLRFAAALAALGHCAGEAIVAATGLATSPAPATRSHVRVFAKPLALRPMLDEADLCVGHGGSGFATAALLAGVPLVLLPMHLEQERIAERLCEQGLALIARDANEVGSTLRAALGDTAMRERARDFARRHERARGADAAREAAARLARLAA